uniref:Malic enzyme n=1 Tax=Globodera rostochiensis TaxID=31243 RepID=A0A914GT99_GLORO
MDRCEPKGQQMSLWELYRHEPCPPTGSGGYLMLKNNRSNKGLAHSLAERHMFGIEGLMPQGMVSQEHQVRRVIKHLRAQPDDMARFVQLEALRERNEKLFFRVMREHLGELLPIVYTPTVGDACINFEYRYPKALFVNINSHNNVSAIYRVLGNWKHPDVRAIVVTDGERILGLGDLGVGGVEISVGKLSLYVALGGVQPQWCLPVQLDVGTDNAKLLNDPDYMGLRQPRVRGEQYDQFIDNFMVACRKKYGQHLLIQFEDFGKNNADRLLKRYQDEYCTFNDDIQGTASVSVAGLLAAVRITGRKICESKFLFHGAGTAAIGISELLVSQMQIEGLSREEACKRIFLVKSDGLVIKSRKNLMEVQKPFAKEMADLKDLADVVKAVQPSAIIGVSTIRGAFTDSIVKEMAKFNKRPIIFALSNPTSKSECTAEAAYIGTNGTALFASGSPFAAVKIADGRTFTPGQCNNSYIFPGVALGIMLFKVAHIANKLFLIAAVKLAESVTDAELASGCLYPSLDKVPEISIKIAVAIAEECYKDGMAKLYPEPVDKELFVRSQVYNTDYEDMMPKIMDQLSMLHNSTKLN